jgi:O-antigen ligase
MSALTRAGWLASAAFFAALLVSIVHVDFAGPLPLAALVGVAAFACVRPAWALPAVMGLVPVAWYGASRLWSPQIGWAEALVCAALAGFGVDAARGRTPVPRALAAPAAVFGAIVVASLAASLRVLALRGGPPFWSGLAHTLSREYFTDHSLTSVHAALLLLEGILIFAHAARLSTTAGVLRRVCAATAIGSAVAATCTFVRLAQSAARAVSFWPSLFDLAGRLRWNVHYADHNAAGSYFALALLAGAGVAATSGGARRMVWTLCVVCSALALWLTSSRIAVLAVLAAAAGALFLPYVIRGRRQAILAAAAGVAACAVLTGAAVALPQRGLQRSPLLAADVRVGLILTGVRMMRASPAFGIGLGEFHRRTAEFSSPDLLEKFPAVRQGENAHNNVVQVAAETGIAGGLAFTWTILAALIVVGWRATVTRDRLLQLALAALVAFSLTALVGHPLLVPEAAFAFWIFTGAAAGAALHDRPAAARSRRSTWLVAAALALVAGTLPLRMRAAALDANLEHIGIGVSAWSMSPDGIRYREAVGQATLFVPAGAYKFSVNARAADLVRLEVSVDGRIADVVSLAPGHWVDIVIPARHLQTEARHRRMDLRTLPDPSAILWLTKDEPVIPR